MKQFEFNIISVAGDGAIDCLDIRDKGVTVSGVYNITLGGSKLTRVYCDMDTDGAGWTVFQRRIDGDVHFYLGWNDYKVGFGDVADEFWLGNENLYLLTSFGETEMRIDLEDFENITVYADYASFWVGDETTSYRLHVSGFSGSKIHWRTIMGRLSLPKMMTMTFVHAIVLPCTLVPGGTGSVITAT
ncbi:Ficolin-1 [Mizuhopecten yessoensis]|uniref:Ficolin-1 n=1 Tax=Mizuhopecten yessoensis TaxID=6573 RepID=A0A210QH90_MIZYE|nr:Ficolin-1 [Mizuhopecten yessoensis]